MTLTIFEQQYDEAVRKWLSVKICGNTDRYKEISNVRFDSEDLGRGCDTCGHGGGHNNGIFYDWQGRGHHYNLDGYGLGKFVAEVVDGAYGKDEIPL